MSQYMMPISETMSTNVDMILNEVETPGSPNKSSLSITRRPKFGTVKIKCIFHGDNKTNGRAFELEPMEINKLIFEQDFQNKYADEITLNVSMMPTQYLQLFDNSRGLKCTLTFTPCDLESGNEDIDDSWSREYLVIFKDKTDLRKKYGKKSLIPDKASEQTNEQQGALIPDIEFQLMDETAYHLRKIKFNFQARGVTVRDVILFVCKMCKIKKIAIIEPDNTTVYENFVVPPNMTFDQLMGYIHAYYGVYNKGLSYYYSEDILYVYPTDEVEPTTPESAHFYYVGNNYTGLAVCHAYSNDITHIVLTDFTKVKDLQDSGAETMGTAIIIQDATRIIDKQSTIAESPDINKGATGLGKVTLSEINTNIFSPKESDLGMSYDTYQPMFKFDNANPYTIRTSVNSYRKAVVFAKWYAAKPFSLKPGYKIYYHYDSEDTTVKDQEATISADVMYVTKTGICDSICYTYRMSGKSGTQHTHTCEAELALSVQYDKANEEPKAQQTSTLDAARSTKEVSSGGQNVSALSGGGAKPSGGALGKGKVGIF